MIRILAFIVALMWGQAAWAACATPSGSGLVLSFVDAKFVSQVEVSAGEGHVIYDPVTKKIKLCDGENWVTFLTGVGGAGATTTSGKIIAAKGFETPHMRWGFYHYSSTAGGAETTRKWLHLKTNLTMISRMQTIEYKGYEFKASKTINARIGFYAYGAGNDIIYIGRDGSHNVNVYKSADGHAVLAIELYEYYVGFVLNQYGANPTGMYPIAITARQWTTSNVGAY